MRLIAFETDGSPHVGAWFDNDRVVVDLAAAAKATYADPARSPTCPRATSRASSWKRGSARVLVAQLAKRN